MANIVKPVGKLAAKVLGLPTSAQQLPGIEAPKVMPTADAEAVRKAKLVASARARAGSGRSGTMLSKRKSVAPPVAKPEDEIFGG